MTLIALESQLDVTRAYEVFTRALSNTGQKLRREVGYQGGSEEADVIWYPREAFWAHFKPACNRYWCPFGLTDPNTMNMLSITCEINPPLSGIDRRCAGLFATDATGNLYLLHSGKVGGGKPGVGKEAFLAFLSGDDLVNVNLVNVDFSDRESAKYIVVSRLDDPGILSHLSDFVCSVARFKKSLTILRGSTGGGVG